MSKQIVERIAATANISKTEATNWLKTVTSAIKDTVAAKGSVSIINFGSFTVKPFKRTSKLHGKTYNIEKNIVRFKAGAGFDKAINS